MMDTPADLAAISRQLHELKTEHRDLDLTIARLQDSPADDELLVRRLKKRKLGLKDRITYLERLLDPDVPA